MGFRTISIGIFTASMMCIIKREESCQLVRPLDDVREVSSTGCPVVD